MDFVDISFGLRSTEEEEAERGDQFLADGFFDPFEGLPRLLDRNVFLITGRKGTGKTMFCRRLHLEAQSSHDLFVSDVRVAHDVTLKDFESVGSSSAERRANQVDTWKLILLVVALESIARDESLPSDHRVHDVVRQLRDLGLNRTQGFRKIVRSVWEKKWVTKVNTALPVLNAGLTYQSKSTNSRDAVDQVNRALFAAIEGAAGANRHLVIVDGLDDLMKPGSMTRDAVRALIRAAKFINERLWRDGGGVKVVVAVRQDIFDRLQDSNLNKLKTNTFMLRLDWASTGDRVRDSPLFQLLTHRAGQPGVDAFFSNYLRFASKEPEKTGLMAGVLQYTRHVPRDLVELFGAVQGVTQGAAVADATDFQRALAPYCKDYFSGEVRDELSDLFEDDWLAKFYRCFGRLDSARFSRAHFQGVAKKLLLAEAGIDDALELLYDCGAIAQTTASSIVYRVHNPDRDFDPQGNFMLHPAWTVALGHRPQREILTGNSVSRQHGRSKRRPRARRTQ